MVNDFKHRSTGVDHASHVLTIGGGSVFRFYSPSLAVPCPSSLNRSSVMPPVGANNYAANKSSQLDSSIVRNPSRTPFFGSQTESVARVAGGTSAPSLPMVDEQTRVATLTAATVSKAANFESISSL